MAGTDLGVQALDAISDYSCFGQYARNPQEIKERQRPRSGKGLSSDVASGNPNRECTYPLSVRPAPVSVSSDDEGLGRSPTETRFFTPPSPRRTSSTSVDCAAVTEVTSSSAKLISTLGPQECSQHGNPRSTEHPITTQLSSQAANKSLRSPRRHPPSWIENTIAESDTVTLSGTSDGIFARLNADATAELAAAYFNAAISATTESSSNGSHTAIEMYEKAVSLGHTKAKVNLAQLYLNMADLERQSRGRQILMDACRDHDPVALAYVGAAYRTGSRLLRVTRDTTRAARILRKAVTLGNPDAMLQLSLLLSAIGENDREAFDLCRRAAKFRLAAQRRLSQLYSLGRGVDADQRLSQLYCTTARCNADALRRQKHRDSAVLDK